MPLRLALWVQVSAITSRLEVSSHFLDARGQRAGFVLLGAFLLSFLFIRTSARFMRSPKVPWWPGSVTTSGGLHLHHLVFGIGLLLLAGFLGFATSAGSPWNEILAGAFGVGAGLTLDEFACGCICGTSTGPRKGDRLLTPS